MNGTCYFCGARMVLRKSSLLPNPDAAKHLDECWVYRMTHRRDIEASSQFGRHFADASASDPTEGDR